MPDHSPLDASISLTTATSQDFEALLALRIAAMRDSLEQIGRFDPDRSRERFRANFVPQHTRHISVGGARVGFVAIQPRPLDLYLDHLYVRPGWQDRGIGSAVLQMVFAQADSLCLPVKLAALRDSPSNRFYQRHGFQLLACEEFDNFYARPAQSAEPARHVPPIADVRR